MEKRPERKRPWFPVSTGAHPAREGARGRGGVRGVPRWTRWSQGSFGGLCAGAATSTCVRLRRDPGSVRGGGRTRLGARGRADPHPRRETNSKYFGQTSTQTRLGRGRGEPQERLCPAAKGAPLSGRDAPELVYRARETVRSNEKGFLRRDASSVRAAGRHFSPNGHRAALLCGEEPGAQGGRPLT